LDIGLIEMPKTKEQKNKSDKISIVKTMIKVEIKAIKKDYDPSNWDYIEVDRMESDEAFNRGCYRVYNQVLSWLNSK